MPARIMVFNDDSDTLNMYEALLELSGFSVTVHRAPKLPQNIAADLMPDLIILDWVYGYEEHGAVLLKQVWSDPRTTSIPTIVCTAAEPERLEGHEEDFKAHGVALLRKPFLPADLTTLIATQIGSV